SPWSANSRAQRLSPRQTASISPMGVSMRPSRSSMGDFALELSNRLGEHLAHGGDGLLDVVFRGRPVDEGDAHDAHAAPCGTAEPGDAFCLNAADHLVGSPIVIAVAAEKPHQPLIYDRPGDNLRPGEFADAGDQPGGMGTAALDDLGNAGAAKGADGSVGREAAAAARPFGI